MPKNLKNHEKSEKMATAFSAVLVILAVIAVGTTLAYVIAKTNPIENTFTPPNVDVELDLSAGSADIVNNLVVNEGDVPVYARVAVVATWVKTDANGVEQTYSTMPNITVTPNTGWVQGTDGFYYLKTPLAAGADSAPIASIVEPTNGPEGYTLKVQILAGVIQATPTTAVIEAWGVTVDGSGNLTVN